MVSGYVSVATGTHSSLVFSVSGQQTLDFARSFAAAVASAQNYTDIATQPGAMHQLPGQSLGITEYLLLQSNKAGPVTATMPGSGYLLDNWSGPNTITGSGLGDTVLVAGINSAATYVDKGGTNSIIFTSGNNLYVGSDTVSSQVVDTIVAGPGKDTIITGSGDASVFGGSGNALIFLDDTTTGSSSANDIVYLNDTTGHGVVVANGVNDYVVSNGIGNQIFGSNTAGTQIGVVFGSAGLTAATNTADLFVANASNSTVYDNTSGNAVFGGSGQLVFIAGTGVNGVVVAGTGENIVFGNSGSDINIYTSAADTAGNIIVAGSGNESLLGGASAGNQIFWANTTDSSASALITGGQGNDTFVSGTGSETVNSGAGANMFVIADNNGMNNITINDFGTSANNFVHFNYDQATLQQALENEKEVNGNLVLQLNDTTVTFVGISSLSGHIK